MIVPRSVNNEIFRGEYFKLRIQVLQLVTDVVSLLGEGWSGASAKKVRKFPCIVSSEDKHQFFSLESNCKHNCRTNIDTASSDHPFSPPTNFSMPRLTRRDNFLQSFLMKTNIKYVHYCL